MSNQYSDGMAPVWRHGISSNRDQVGLYSYIKANRNLLGNARAADYHSLEAGCEPLGPQ